MSQRLRMLERSFASSRRPLLMCALVAGDPHVGATLKYMGILAEQGADVIELIVPFSDPTYHGPVIQRASARAIHEDVDWPEICELVGEFRERYETPVVVSGYFNRFLARGVHTCGDELASAGVDGVMVADLPWDEAEEFEKTMRARGLSVIRTVAPTTPLSRFRAIANGAEGFLVWTGHSGGEVTISGEEFRESMGLFHEHTHLPLVVSMKISTGEDAAAVARYADGALVGSALVWLIEGRGPDLKDRLAQFVRELRHHLDADGR